MLHAGDSEFLVHQPPVDDGTVHIGWNTEPEEHRGNFSVGMGNTVQEELLERGIQQPFGDERFFREFGEKKPKNAAFFKLRHLLIGTSIASLMLSARL